MQSVLRWIFWKIDGIIALFIRFLYGLIFDISSARILENYIYEFMGRVYTLLAIFMLFKLSISVVNYILNPDQLTDKSKGFSKLIQNVIIVMALVIMTPQLFDWAYKLQCLILNSGVINTIITNEPNSMSSKEVTAACFGGEDQCYSIKQSKKANSYLLTYSLYSTFVYAKDGDDDSIADISDSSANTRYKSFKTCAEAVQTDSTYVEANNCIFNWKTVKRNDNEYLLLASTACLGFTAYVLLVFAIDIAIRSVKLCFLQLIAPVPIISMLDPNSGKSGMFSKWLKECGKTYGLLFLRLAIVYFVSEIISQVLKDGITTASGCSISMLAKIFIVLGALAFAKQLPQFIESITGIKLDGGLFSLKKRLDNIPGSKAAGTLGKKTIAGVDAIMNGKKFRDGWNKIEGTGPLAKFQKWKAGVMPYTAEHAKNKREGYTEVNDLDVKWNKGKNAANKLGDNWKNALDGINQDNYEKVFANKDFISSKMNLDREDDKLKAIRQRNAERSSQGILTAEDAKELENQEKKVSGLQKVHDSMRKVYWQDAELEDAFKFYKNNETNPANISQHHPQGNAQTQQNSNQNINQQTNPVSQQNSNSVANIQNPAANSRVNSTMPDYSTQEGARDWDQFDT